MAQVFFTCGHNRAPGPIYTHLGFLYLHLHQLRLRYSVNSQLLIPLLPMPSNVALWPPFRGHRPPLCAPRLAVPAPSHQLRLRYSVNSQLLIPLLPMPSNVALWPPFRGHRPPLCAPRLAVPAPSHQLRLRYSVNSQLLIPLLPMPSNVALWPPFRGHRPPLCAPRLCVPAPSHQLRLRYPLWRKCFALVHTEPVPSHQCLRPPSLPFSALWATFRAHRPPLCAPRLAVPAPSHQLRLRYSVNSQLLIPLLPMPSNVALWPPFRGHRPPLCAPRLSVHAPSHQLRLRYSVNSQLLIPLLPMPSNVALWPPLLWRKCFSLVAIIGPVGPIYIHLGLLYLPQSGAV